MRLSGHRAGLVLLLVVTAMTLSGCFDLIGDKVEDPTTTVTDPQPTPPPGNNPPTISGAPSAGIKIGDTYSFQPSASDPDGDTLTFSIQNKPPWATFDTGNGRLSGTARLGDIGTYENIAVSVSDGEMATQLPQFSIRVVQQGTGTATLSWTPPTQNVDGTPLTNLAGYKIYYGVAEGDYPNEILINNPGIATYVVEYLTPNTYYFVATAVNVQGLEGEFSNVMSKTVL